MLIGYFVMLPEDYKKLMESSLWSLFSAANLYFFGFLDTSYFSSSSSEVPLLHLWSLGVEEQFYIIWPLLIIISLKIFKSVKHESIFFAILFISSLLSSEILRSSDFSFTYYMLPTRAWELLAGGLAALAVFKKIKVNNKLLAALSLGGFLTIFLCIFFIDEKLFIPGVGALPAVIGATLVIFSGHYQRNIPAIILSNNILVYIGIISFSAYLWHWPILAFLRYAMVEINLKTGFKVLLLTFGLAQLSYVLVEKPLRKIKTSPKKAIGYFFVIPCVAIGTYCSVAIGMTMDKSSSFYNWSEFDKAQQAVMPAYDYNFNCQASDFDPSILSEDRCVYPIKSNPKTIVVGDSHGAHLVGMLRELSNHYGFSFRNATQSACAFILSKYVDNVPNDYRHGCEVYRATMESELNKYENIIIGVAWSSYFSDHGIRFADEFEKTIKSLAPKMKTIIIANQAPYFPAYNHQCEERNLRINLADCFGRFNEKYQVTAYGDFLKKLASKYSNVYIFDLPSYLCPNGICSPYIEKKPVYYDSYHLSMEGSSTLGEIIARQDTEKSLPFARLR
jgi:peptidoglycan/LPS O-acetylase OafA/YrhL